ncbi:MAG: hypothetical protein LH606_15615, partial [Cytophagaceae bacterium]|nr:hypothetical protein [Cytophagaceae bacterium]
MYVLKAIRITLFLWLSAVGVSAQSISTAKPWTQWWWMGSSVTQQGISQQMTQFARSGLGGVT